MRPHWLEPEWVSSKEANDHLRRVKKTITASSRQMYLRDEQINGRQRFWVLLESVLVRDKMSCNLHTKLLFHVHWDEKLPKLMPSSRESGYRDVIVRCCHCHCQQLNDHQLTTSCCDKDRENNCSWAGHDLKFDKHYYGSYKNISICLVHPPTFSVHIKSTRRTISPAKHCRRRHKAHDSLATADENKRNTKS